MRWAALGLLALALVVWAWPRDAVPSFRTVCEVSCGGRYDAPTVYADSGTAKFVRLAKPIYLAAWFVMSPLAYVLWNIRRFANDLHQLRTRITARIRARAP